MATQSRWLVLLGNPTAEGGSNAGSDFEIRRFTDAGALIDAPLTINRATGAVSERGTQTNDNAAAGMVGELIMSVVLVGSAVTLTSTVTSNITSISLTAGDWDVAGEAWLVWGTGGGTVAQGAISLASATIPGNSTTNQSRFLLATAFSSSQTMIMPLRPGRIQLAATTTVYLVTQATFPSGTVTAYGNISARRAR